MICDFDREELEDGCPGTYKYFFTGQIGHPSCTQIYRWEVFDKATGNKIAQLDSTADYFVYAFPYVGTFTVRLTVTETCGSSCSIEKDYTLDVCPVTTGGGGGPSRSDWEQQYEEAKPDVRIIRVYFEDTEPPPEIKLKIRGGVVMKD